MLVGLSLFSLGSGVEANWISRGVQTVVSVVATPFWRVFSATADSVEYITGFIFSYRDAQREIEELRTELAEKIPDEIELEELQAENNRLARMLQFQRHQDDLMLMTIRVKEIVQGEGTLLVDAGSRQGVRVGMCAMTPEGVVGVVARVEPFFSFVYTIHHPDCRIGAVIKRNRVYGRVRGSGSDITHMCRMEFIDMKDDIRKDDVIVTCGSSVFPRGIPIGTVSSWYDEGTMLKTAYVVPYANPYRVEELFLVQRAQVPDNVLAANPEDSLPAGSHGYPMPERRTLQERWAP